MKTLYMTPDTLRKVLQHANENPLPTAVAEPLLDFVHETVRNADDLDEAALVFVDAGEIINCVRRLLDGGRTADAAVQEAFALQFGAGSEPDEQVRQIVTAATHDAVPTPHALADAAELIDRLGFTLYDAEVQ